MINHLLLLFEPFPIAVQLPMKDEFVTVALLHVAFHHLFERGKKTVLPALILLHVSVHLSTVKKTEIVTGQAHHLQTFQHQS